MIDMMMVSLEPLKDAESDRSGSDLVLESADRIEDDARAAGSGIRAVF